MNVFEQRSDNKKFIVKMLSVVFYVSCSWCRIIISYICLT